MVNMTNHSYIYRRLLHFYCSPSVVLFSSSGFGPYCVITKLSWAISDPITLPLNVTLFLIPFLPFLPFHRLLIIFLPMIGRSFLMGKPSFALPPVIFILYPGISKNMPSISSPSLLPVREPRTSSENSFLYVFPVFYQQ